MGGSGTNYLNPWTPADGMSGNNLMKKLAESGFDMWFANNSGTIYSQQHDVYTIYDPEFWDLDLTDWGVFDFPALVEKIQSVSDSPYKKVAVIGHS